jgi:non-heme chloroperoxidase
VVAVERWTTRTGSRLRYLDNAPDEPEGLPILFAPGLSDLADEYLDMLEHVGPRRLLAVEVRGRGRSDAPPSGYSVADQADDLEAVLDEEGIDRFHLMTFSRGTSWGLELALRAPERVASVAIGDYKAVEVGLPETFVDWQMGTTFRGRPMEQRIDRRVLQALVRDSVARELWDELTRLPGPLLVARPGGEGGILGDDAIERYRTARPDVEVVVIPDAPHDLFRPDRLAYPRAVLDFLRRRCPGE